MLNARNWSTKLLSIVVVVALVMAFLPWGLVGNISVSAHSGMVPEGSRTGTESPSRVTQIAAGGTHSCALTPEGGVVCWGANSSGELGDGTTEEGNPTPVVASGLHSGVMSLALAWGRTCALTTHGSVYCWGKGATADGAGSLVPVIVSGLGNQVVQLAVGEFHACALTSSGKVMCWGFNSEGELGNGTFTDSFNTPVVAIASGATQITVFNYTSCAVVTNGEVKCWGDGGRGQLGDGSAAPEGGSHRSNVPVNVVVGNGSHLGGASQVSLGLTFACALVGSGVDCWGTNRFGQLGIGVVYDGARPFAAPVLNAVGGDALGGIDQIATGEGFICARLVTGRIKCWGQNIMGQAGNGTTAVSVALPVAVLDPSGMAPLEGALRITTGNHHACIFTNWEADHPFYCWGHDAMGQLGVGSITGFQTLPHPVGNISGLNSGELLEPQIVAGGAHTCSLTTGGGLKCWGSNTRGQLGDGTTTNRLNPVEVAGLSSGIKSMALGDHFTCVIGPWGWVKCWGENTHGQLGNGSKSDSSLPVRVNLPGVTVAQVAAGSGHTCALTQTGSVLCWGDNTFGQLGDGTTTESTDPVVAIDGVTSSALGIAAGGSTTCAVMSGGGVQCWGLGDVGQVGDGGSGAGYKQLLATPVQVSGGGLLMGTTQVAVGANFGCALMAGGSVDCWGKNDFGQLGQGAASAGSAFALPVRTEAGGSLLDGATQVTAGGAHACVRMYTNRLKCWGQGELGQLGDGSSGSGVLGLVPHTVVDHYAPFEQTIPYLEVVSQVSAGGGHTCAFLRWDGSNPYRCWGDNSSGQLGDGGGTSAGQIALSASTAIKPYPNLVSDSFNFGSPPLAKIAAGSLHTCALTKAGGVKCWGGNLSGQLGDGSNTPSQTPVNVIGLSSGVIGLASGGSYSCAVTTAGGAVCWGLNYYAQLGDVTRNDSNIPVNVVGLNSGVISLSTGQSHTCALTKEGGVLCWGNNFYGQIGDGTTTLAWGPTSVYGLSSGVIALALGYNHSCALTALGGVKCWGLNMFGQLGDGTNTDSSIPVDVNGLASGAIELAVGANNTCALMASGGVKCWGRNDTGQLGDGTITNHDAPVDVVGLSSEATGLAAGDFHICAMMAAGGVKCWGDNRFGNLGDGTTTYHSTPVSVTGLVGNVISLTAGASHTCAVMEGKSPVRCWGSNQFGQFGDGTTTGKLTPVDSKWLTADGLVEDEKDRVIDLVSLSAAVVVPAQPLETPVVVTVTEVTSPPPPCTACIAISQEAAFALDDDSKTTVHSWFYFDYSNSQTYSPTSLQAVSGFDERGLNLFHYVDGTWIPMLPCTGCSLDSTNHVLIAVLDGPGQYQLMVQTSTDIYLPLVTR